MSTPKKLGSIVSIVPNKVEYYYLIKYKGGESARLSIVNDHVVRFYMSPKGTFLEYPETCKENRAKIVPKPVMNEKAFKNSDLKGYQVKLKNISIKFNKEKGTMSAIYNTDKNKKIFGEKSALTYVTDKGSQTTQELIKREEEYFFGCGLENNAFNLTTELDIRDPNSYPFYWSSKGYGVLRNTWKFGKYDFSLESKIKTTHDTDQFDAFYFFNDEPKGILKDYFELTGNPTLMPEYALYEGHLGDFKSSLNGEDESSAKTMVDKYKKNDMPLGWFIPNHSMDTNYDYGTIDNLKTFVEYAGKRHVKVALKHQIADSQNVEIELSEANIHAYKIEYKKSDDACPIMLSTMEDISNVFAKCCKKKRPMIFVMSCWAGTHRYGCGMHNIDGESSFQFIENTIISFIGAGLSGLPLVASYLDGAYQDGTGILKEIKIRDYQWKTFTPIQMIFDINPALLKTPFAIDEETTNINRAYLKLKSMLTPYNYTIAQQSTIDLPMIRAMFLEFPKDKTAWTQDCQYQYMWGKYFLIAPIHESDKSFDFSNRKIYLPDKKQFWIDFFTGQKYRGGNTITDTFLLWKLPVFIKDGAIIPWVSPNNNPEEIRRENRIFSIYPNGNTEFTVYEDDGISQVDENSKALTTIKVDGPKSNRKDDLTITIAKTDGHYEGLVPMRASVICVMSAADVPKQNITARFNGDPIKLKKGYDAKDAVLMENGFFCGPNLSLNPYFDKIVANKLKQPCISIKLKKVNVKDTAIKIVIKDYQNKNCWQ